MSKITQVIGSGISLLPDNIDSGRTLLMSPAMVTAAAIEGEVTDVREMLSPVGV